MCILTMLSGQCFCVDDNVYKNVYRRVYVCKDERLCAYTVCSDVCINTV